uniref:Uncharacterized protein n=1 Tax=Rhizophora mucronata TaxID=61149 RepID=A0A2P2K9U5_RHIMU
MSCFQLHEMIDTNTTRQEMMGEVSLVYSFPLSSLLSHPSSPGSNPI